MSNSKPLLTLYAKLQEIYKLECIYSLLDWDHKVCMPQAGAKARSEQLELVAGLIHEKRSDDRLYETLQKLEAKTNSLDADDQVNVRETLRVVDRARKLPQDFVAEKTRVHAECYQIWEEARPADNFELVKEHLTRVFKLARDEAHFLGFKENPYDALLESYEPHTKVSEIKPILLELGQRLSDLLPKLKSLTSGSLPVSGEFSEELQKKLNSKVALACGYSAESGRIDRTLHPFQASMGPRDSRITTRYSPNNYLQSMLTTLHEIGHALYELGFEEKHYSTPLAQAVSLGIHESQSRLWENFIGRSKEFCVWIHQLLKDVFPDEGKKISPEVLWKRLNKIESSLIRVEADEATYAQHIVIRMLLEDDLINAKLEVEDLPQAWDDLYEKYLGIKSEDDTNGVLQDVHWYSGLIGYFPTYALGNLYAAQMYEVLRKDIDDLDQRVEKGELLDIREWLRDKVHKHGQRYRAGELIERISGKKLSAAPFLNYLAKKFGD